MSDIFFRKEKHYLVGDLNLKPHYQKAQGLNHQAKPLTNYMQVMVFFQKKKRVSLRVDEPFSEQFSGEGLRLVPDKLIPVPCVCLVQLPVVFSQAQEQSSAFPTQHPQQGISHPKERTHPLSLPGQEFRHTTQTEPMDHFPKREYSFENITILQTIFRFQIIIKPNQ